MADESSDVTEIVDAAVCYDTDEGDDGVLENPVAPKKLKGSEWKIIRSNNDYHFKFFCEFVNGRNTDERMCTKCSRVEISVNYGTSSKRTHWNACKDRQSGKSKQGPIQLLRVLKPAVSTILKERKSDKFHSMSFDKWKADGNIMYIGELVFSESKDMS